MTRLLNAGFTRLRKNKMFWLLTIFSIGLALFILFSQYREMIKYGSEIELQQLIFDYAAMIGVVIAIFTSLFLGVEYSDGIIRNKISIGHKRGNIYLSNLIIVMLSSLFSYLLFMVFVFVIGVPLFGNITIPLSSFLTIIGLIFLNVLAYASIFTFIAMIISSKTISAVTSIMLAFGLMIFALVSLNILFAKEYIQVGTYVDGKMQLQEQKNPKYPSEAERKVHQTLVDINPAGQMYQLLGRTAPNLKVLPIYSLSIIVLFTGTGLVLFKRKELK